MSAVTLIQGSILATWALGFITVCLRFFARRISKAGFWYDDWLIVPATLFATALCSISVIVTKQALSQNFESLSPTELEFFKKAVYITEICWVVVTWIVKYSILAFYWRLFSANGQSTRKTIWAFAAFVTCWGTAVVFLTIFQCVHIGFAWELPVRSLCHGVPYYSLILGSSIPHVVADMALLGFPVPLIWNIHMHKSQKIMLTAIFALGSFVTIVSIVRLTYIVNTYLILHSQSIASSSAQKDYSYDAIWSCVEPNMSIVCACLPSLRPILPFISEKLKLLRKRKSTHKRGSKLLMDMLPARRRASSPVLPLSTRQSWDDGPHPMLDSSTFVEAEARNPRVPEIDAEAPGPNILEIETVEAILEMYSPRSITELEGNTNYVAEL